MFSCFHVSAVSVGTPQRYGVVDCIDCVTRYQPLTETEFKILLISNVQLRMYSPEHVRQLLSVKFKIISTCLPGKETAADL